MAVDFHELRILQCTVAFCGL